MIVTDQKISETIPKTLVLETANRVWVVRVERRLDRVERARAEVAEDDPERADHERRLRGVAPVHPPIFASAPEAVVDAAPVDTRPAEARN